MPTLYNNTPGRPAMNYDFGGYGSSLDSYIRRLQNTQGPIQLWKGLAPGIANEVGFFNEASFGRTKALRNAAEALDPANRGAIVDSFATNAKGQVAGNARRTASSLFRNFGSQPGLQAGAEIAAMNEANDQTGQFRSQIYSPFNLANMYLGQANVLSAGNILQGFERGLPLLGMRQQMKQQQGGGFLDTLTGLAGTAFAGGWAPFG